MATEKCSEAASAESFCPSEEDIEKWMNSAFDMVGDRYQTLLFNQFN